MSFPGTCFCARSLRHGLVKLKETLSLFMSSATRVLFLLLHLDNRSPGEELDSVQHLVGVMTHAHSILGEASSTENNTLSQSS